MPGHPGLDPRVEERTTDDRLRFSCNFREVGERVAGASESKPPVKLVTRPVRPSSFEI